MTVKVLSGKCRGDYDILFIIDDFCDVIRIDVFSGNWISVNRCIIGRCFLDRNRDSIGTYCNGNWFCTVLHDYITAAWTWLYESRCPVDCTGNLRDVRFIIGTGRLRK